MANDTNLSNGAGSHPSSGPSPSIIAGLVAGLISFSVLVIFYVLVDDKMVSQPFLYASSAVLLISFLAATIYSIYATHKNSGDNDLRIGRSIVAGLKTAIALSVVYGLLRYLFFAYLAPEVVEIFLGQIEEGMREQGIAGADLERGVKLNKQLMYGPLSIPLMILTYGFIGIFVSLISAFIMRALRS